MDEEVDIVRVNSLFIPFTLWCLGTIQRLAPAPGVKDNETFVIRFSFPPLQF